MTASNSQTAASIKREVTELMSNLEFPNNITPKKKPWLQIDRVLILHYDPNTLNDIILFVSEILMRLSPALFAIVIVVVMAEQYAIVFGAADGWGNYPVDGVIYIIVCIICRKPVVCGLVLFKEG